MNNIPDPQQPSRAEQQTQTLLNQVRQAAPEQPHGQLLLMLCECIQRLDNLERLVREAFQAISAPDPQPPPQIANNPQQLQQQQLRSPPTCTIEASHEAVHGTLHGAVPQPEQQKFPRIYPPPPRGPEDVSPLTAA